MALFRKFFYRKPPEGLLEISERVYVFDCCFTTNLLEGNEYQVYIGRIVDQLREYFPDASFMVFSFGDGDYQKQIINVLYKYGMTLIDYPCQYENCPLLTLEMIHHFLRSSESWLCIGQRNVLLMLCQNGALPVLVFVLAAFLIYRKQYTGEKRTLDMVYKQAPQDLLHLSSSLNPLPSQLRYLQYISRRNIGSRWPPLDRALTLDCIILRFIPNMDGKGGCRPIFRIYGPDPLMAADRKTKMLFSMPKKCKAVGYFKQADCELVKIHINCHVQGDVVLECITLDDGLEHEEMMFRVMFNTAFIRSNVLMLNREEIDILWNAKDKFPSDFRAEVLFSEMDSSSSLVGLDLPGIQDIEGLPIEAFAKVQDIFNNLDWGDSERDNALNIIQQMTVSSILEEKLEITLFPSDRKENWQNVPLSMKDEQLESVFLLDDIAKRIKSGSAHVNEAKSKIDSKTVQKGNISIVSHSVVKEGGFLEASPTTVESPKSEVFENDTSSPPAELSETQLVSSKSSLDLEYTTKKIESSEPHVSVQRPAQSKIISARISQSSPSTTASYSNSSQGSPVAVSRFRNAPSAVGITALLHDHAEFSNKEVCCSSTPESSISASAPCLLKPVQPTDSSVSLPETHPLGKYYINSKSGSRASPHPPPPPPPPPPPMLLSTRSLTPQPQLGQPPPSLSLLPSTAPSPPPPSQSNSDLSASQLPTTPYSHGSRMSGHIGQQLQPPLPPPPPTPFSPTPSLLPYSEMISSIDQSPTLSPSFTAEAGPSFRSQSSAPPSPSPTPHPSSVTALPGLSNTLSAYLPPPPPLPPIIGTAKPPSLSSVPSPPPPPSKTIPSPPTPLPEASSIICQDSSMLPAKQSIVPVSPPPPPPPQCAGSAIVSPSRCSAPPPPCPPGLVPKEGPARSRQVVPLPPAPLLNASSKAGDTSSLQLHSSASTLLGGNGKLQLRTSTRIQTQSRKTSLKPYHWLKLTRAMQGSLWAEAQKPEEASKAPELDMSELESLFSATIPNSDHGGPSGKTNRRGSRLKNDKVHLIELRRAYNCEIMLTKVKIPLSDLTNSVLALDDSALDIDQVDNLIKFCPTKEEIELLKNYKGDKENLGKCEQFFLELMKVPRVESKLRVFSFKIQFCSQVSDLRNSLNTVNSASEEVRNSVKLKRIMQTILSLGNALNHGTARGSAVGFRLDSLPKLAETRARNNKLTLIHYLCKVLAEKLPEVLDFHEDLVSLEAATKIQLKYLAEEMQAISKGLEKVVQELAASENDGAVSEHFCKTLKKFLGSAEAEVRSLASLYSGVGRNADALALYFGEDPARCPFEQVVSTLLNFVRMFRRAHEENCKQLEFEKRKKAQEQAENGKAKSNTSRHELENENMMASATKMSELQPQL